MSQDGFGTRTLFIDPDNGDAVEVLAFADTLASQPEFAAAVGERVARLARVRHTMYARVRKIERPSQDALLLHSDHVPGWRLGDVLSNVEREGWLLDISTVLALLRQLIPAVALFSRHQRDATIGTLGPERLILTPQGRLVIAEFVLGPGLEKVQFSRDRLWREYRVAMPPTVSLTKIPPNADVVGIGTVALSLLLGRLLRDDEFLVSLGDLFESLTETSAGSTKPLSATFRTWLARALQFEGHSSFQTTQEAQVAFEEMLAKERSYVTSSAPLNQFVNNYERLAGVQPTPTSVTAPPVVEDVTPPKAPASARSTTRPNVAPAAAVGPASPAAPVAAEALEAAEAPEAPEPREAHGAREAHEAREAPEAHEAPAGSWHRYAMVGLVAITLLEAGAIAWLISRTGPAVVDRGEVSVQSSPVGARVIIDREERGTTPLAMELAEGYHLLDVRVGRSERTIPFMIRPGVRSEFYIELQNVATVGGLEVRTDPAKAQVTVGGQERGLTPLLLRDLPPGDIEVVVRLGGREVRQMVRIEPGITSQLVVPLTR